VIIGCVDAGELVYAIFWTRPKCSTKCLTADWLQAWITWNIQ